MIESENFHEDSKTVEKPTDPKGQSKVSAVIVDNAAQQIQLQGAVKGLSCYRVISKTPKCNKFHHMDLIQCKTTL